MKEKWNIPLFNGLNRKIPVTFIIVILLMSFLFPSCYGFDALEKEIIPQGAAARKQVIMLVLDRITFSDLRSLPGPVFSSLLEKSAVAIKNVNTAGAPETEGGYLTIGSGSRLKGHRAASLAFNRSEKWDGAAAEKLYKRHAGDEAGLAAGVLHPYTILLKQINSTLRYPSEVGALGDLAARSGLQTAVIGNADTDYPGRQAATIVMTGKGEVNYGKVDETLLHKDEKFPYGHRSDAYFYLEAFNELEGKADLVVVEWGDTTRVDSYARYLTPSRRKELLKDSFRELDLFLSGIMPVLQEEGTLLLILTPSPPRAAYSDGQRLTPLVLYNSALPGGGLLFSETTRRPGIVSNLDIAPAVAEYFDISLPVHFLGAPLQVQAENAHLEKVAKEAEVTSLIYAQRPSIIRGYITALIVFLLGGLAAVLLRSRHARKLSFYILALMHFPLAALAAPVFGFYPLPSAWLNAFLLAGLLIFASWPVYIIWKKNPLAAFALSGYFIFALLVLDLLWGAPLNSRSFLGYDPVGGARFYGLGNEYMGVMVGSLLLGGGSLFSIYYMSRSCVYQARVLFLLFLFVLVLMASPRYGANLGGTIAGAAAASVAAGWMSAVLRQRGESLIPEYLLKPFNIVKNAGLMNNNNSCSRNEHSGREKGAEKVNSRRGRIFTSRHLLPLAFLGLVPVLLYYQNVLASGEAVSHLGRTWELVQQRGAAELVEVVARKVEMNLKLIRYSLWSRLFLVFIIFLVVISYQPVGLMQEILQRNPGLKIALGSIAAGSTAAFFFNDSGIVAAATMMLYGAVPVLGLSLVHAEFKGDS